MTRFRGLTTVAVLFAGVALAADEKEDAKFDAAKMEGTWTITAGMKNGEKAEVDKYKDAVEITKDKITLKTPDGSFVFKYTVDAKASPASVELEIVEPDMFKGSKATGIVKLDGDTLTLCYPAMGGDKPKDFDAKKDSGNYSFTMTKAAKEEKKDK
jgi:uncharacterized protein (TIGR03067 family)